MYTSDLLCNVPLSLRKFETDVTAVESTVTVEEIPEEKPEQADIEKVTVEVSLT